MIAGIDYSTRAVDLVLLDETTDRAVWHRYELTGQDAFERARNVRYRMPGPAHSLWDDVLAVGIEDPRGHNAGALYRIQGAVLACLPARTLVQPWVPSAWRKQVGLPGNASKMAVKLFVDGLRVEYALWGGHGLSYKQPPMWEQDACDAFCLALATRSLLQKAAA